MPFQKGHKLSVGNKGGRRKGYDYEQQEMKRMTKLLGRGLFLAEKMAEGTASIKEQMAYGNIEKLILKIMDKRHATKQENQIEGEIIHKAYNWGNYGADNNLQPKTMDTATPREPKQVEGGGSTPQGGQDNSLLEPLNKGSDTDTK